MGKFRSIGSQARQVAISMFKSGEIRSLATSRNYEQSFRQFGQWLKTQLSKNNAPQLSRATEKICTRYLQERSHEVSQKTLDLDRQALNHLISMNRGEAATALPMLKADKQQQLAPRAYTAAQIAEIEAHQRERTQISTELCYRCGLRDEELLTIRPAGEQPADKRDTKTNQSLYGHLKFEGREGVMYTVVGKGGLCREVLVPHALAERLEARRLDAPLDVVDRRIHYEKHYDIPGGSKFSHSFTRTSNSELGYSNGAHGLRHSYAQERMEELAALGHTDHEALSIVSLEMGHFRTDITMTYLR